MTNHIVFDFSGSEYCIDIYYLRKNDKMYTNYYLYYYEEIQVKY